MHSDKLSLSDMPPAHDLLVTLRILESADKYASTNRKNLRSRLWPEAHDGCSIKVEKVDKVKVCVCARDFSVVGCRRAPLSLIHGSYDCVWERPQNVFNSC